MWQKIKTFMNNPVSIVVHPWFRGVSRFLPDKTYLKCMYKSSMKRRLDLKNPRTMNEKLQWLKLYDRKAHYVNLVDKYAVKTYIGKTIGEEYVIPTLGAWDSFDDIDFETLPDKFVLKCTHDSGGLIVVKDKSKLNKDDAKKKLEKSLKTNYFYYGREWPYKNVPRKIIAEKYMTDSPDCDSFTDYKFYCFNGYVDCVLACLERNTGNTKFYFFDKDWTLKRYNKRGMEAPEGFTIPRSKHMNEMFEIAEKLSAGFAFVRVDLYDTEDHVYFGELTLHPDSGIDANRMPEIDKYFGDLIDLSI